MSFLLCPFSAFQSPTGIFSCPLREGAVLRSRGTRYQSLYIAVINLDNIAVNEHFSGIDGEAARSHLLHFQLNHFPFLRRHRDAKHNVPHSVCHSFTVLSHKGLGLSQQADAPPSGRTGGRVIRECGYTPYACCGISFLTTTTVNTLHFSKPIRKSSRTIHARFLKNCGYSYIIYFVLLYRLERSGV